MHTRRKPPFVFLNVVSTVDGKIAPQTRRFVPFGSLRDQRHLLELRARADAVMAGARTVDLGLVDLGPGPEKFRRLRLRQGRAEFNLRVVVSGSGTLNPASEIFRHRFSPIIVLVSGRASATRIKRLRAVADEVKICGDERIDFQNALTWLRAEWNVHHLLCEGGGEVNAALFQAGLVNEIHLTLAPLVFGGRDAPTLADGHGIVEVSEATQLRLKSCRRVKSELFLVYRVQPLARPLNFPEEIRSETAEK